MNSKLYTIEAISNLHVGSGEVNYGVVDNLIQRDAITDLPVINSSSLKGAFREFNKNSGTELKKIFGSDPKSEDRTAGSFRFFDAYLLGMPVRSDKTPFFMATCPMILKEFLLKSKIFNIELPKQTEMAINNMLNIEASLDNSWVFCKDYQDALIEDIKTPTQYQETANINDISSLIGNAPLVLISDNNFSLLCDNNHLPVIARNYLNNGKSENLFYEQVLPRLSRLYFILMYPAASDINKFNDTLTNKLVQIGANASVGYGYCRVIPFDNLNKKD